MRDLDNIFVTFPASEIIALRGLIKDYSNLADEIHVISRRLDGCYALQAQIMEKLGDLSRQNAGTGATTT